MVVQTRSSLASSTAARQNPPRSTQILKKTCSRTWLKQNYWSERPDPNISKLGFKSASDYLRALCNIEADSSLAMKRQKQLDKRKNERNSRITPLNMKKQGRRDNFSFNLWNCRGLTFERLCYVKEDIGGDVTALVELWGDHPQWTVGDRRVVRCSPVPDSDKAAGVLLVLSNRAADCLMSSGGDEIP